MFRYNYSLSNDFQDGEINEEQLIREINDSSLFGTYTLVDLGKDGGDVIRIVFDIELSVPDKTILDGIVTSHVATIISDNTFVYQTLTPRVTKYNSDAFTRMTTFKFAKRGPEIVSFTLVSYMSVGITSYTARIIDINNKKIIATGTFSNTTETSCSMNVIPENMPFDSTIFEAQIKRNGGTASTNVFVDSITVNVDRI